MLKSKKRRLEYLQINLVEDNLLSLNLPNWGVAKR